MSEQPTPMPGSRAIAPAAALAAAAAVACGVCCVLPFALPAAVLAVAGGGLAWFGRMQPVLTVLALAAVLAAWGWVAWHSWRSRRRPARSTLVALGVATGLLALALAWPLFEGFLVSVLR